MTMPDLVKIIIALTATACVTLTLLVLVNFFRLKENTLREKWPSVCVLIGYAAMFAAVTRSVFKEIYSKLDLWHICVIAGLIFSLAGLIPIFRTMVKKNEQQRVHDYINKVKNKKT